MSVLMNKTACTCKCGPRSAGVKRGFPASFRVSSRSRALAAYECTTLCVEESRRMRWGMAASAVSLGRRDLGLFCVWGGWGREKGG